MSPKPYSRPQKGALVLALGGPLQRCRGRYMRPGEPLAVESSTVEILVRLGDLRRYGRAPRGHSLVALTDIGRWRAERLAGRA